MPRQSAPNRLAAVLRRHGTPLCAMVTACAAIMLSIYAQPRIDTALADNRAARISAHIKDVYTTAYQNAAHERLVAARDARTRTLDDIFISADPYGTNTTSLYMYFTTDEAAKVAYTVSADGYPDFSATAEQGGDWTTEHEFLVLGLVPNVVNTITLTVTDSDGSVSTRTITRHGPTLLGDEEVRLEQTVVPADAQSLGDGLYAILGNDSNDQDFMFYYDGNGVLRGEIPILYYRAHRLLFDDDGLMWFSASTRTMVGMNRLGQLEKIYDLGDRFILHHDYALDDDGDIVLLATDLTRDDHAVQDQVIKLDTDDGTVTHLLDLGDMFPDYKAATYHSGIDESDPSATNRWDWIHINTIQLTDDGSALLSARETSTIIKIDDIETNPTLDYMIGEPSVWSGTSYMATFLTKDGDFSDTGGQHSITIAEDSNGDSSDDSSDDSDGDADDAANDDGTSDDGQYRLYMFDNNFGYAMTRPDYDWTAIDSISTSSKASDPDSTSQYRSYMIDENTGTYSETAAFDVPYSPYVSSAQELGDGHILIDSGMQGLFGVYDSDGTMLAQWRMRLNTTYIYRVYRYDFQGFYFA